MPVSTRLHVGGALYALIEPPKFDPHLKRYTAVVAHANGEKQNAYSRLPAGPFVFTVPSEKEPHP